MRQSQPWIYSPLVDGLFILGVPFFIVAAVFAFPATFTPPDSMNVVSWAILVMGIDVSHVYSTLYRTYLDRETRRNHAVLLYMLPFAVLVVSMLVYAAGEMLFWRVMAYLAVFHFARQQYGFMRVYSRNERQSAALRRIDALAIYTATFYPILDWHLAGQKSFNWFLRGDFWYLPAEGVRPVARLVYLAVIGVYVAKELHLLWKSIARTRGISPAMEIHSQTQRKPPAMEIHSQTQRKPPAMEIHNQNQKELPAMENHSQNQRELPAMEIHSRLFLKAPRWRGWITSISLLGNINWPRNLLVAGTFLSWYYGIVHCNSDLAFTAINVMSHGIPYMALVWIWGNKRHGSPSDRSMVFRPRYVAFYLGLLLMLAYIEEGFWNVWVWHEPEHARFFTLFHLYLGELETGSPWLRLVVPLLSVPQVAHYIMDGFIWKVRNDRYGWSKAVLADAGKIRAAV